MQHTLDVPLKASDKSIVRKLKQPQKKGPCPVIVRFVNRKARYKAYAARCKLRLSSPQDAYDGSPQLALIYINEHLPKETASLFRIACQLVKTKENFPHMDIKWNCLNETFQSQQ